MQGHVTRLLVSVVVVTSGLAFAEEHFVSVARGKGKDATKEKPAKDLGIIIAKLKDGDTTKLELPRKCVGTISNNVVMNIAPTGGVISAWGHQAGTLTIKNNLFTGNRLYDYREFNTGVKVSELEASTGILTAEVWLPRIAMADAINAGTSKDEVKCGCQKP